MRPPPRVRLALAAIVSAAVGAALACGCSRRDDVADRARAAPREGAADRAGAAASDDAMRDADVDSARARRPADDPPPAYRAYPVAATGAWLRYAARLGPERLAIVLKVNRVDRDRVRLGDTLAVPEALADTARATDGAPIDELAFAALPQAVGGLDSVPKLLAISRRVQAFGAYERGRLVRWGPTSTGKKDTPTPDGLFHVNWQARETVSTEDSTWVLRWYTNFQSRRGLSLHEYALPGYPASHACIRLLGADAQWLYGWLEQWIVEPGDPRVVAQGTPILIFGEYAFGHRRPWRRLLDDPLAATVAAAEIDGALAPHVATVAERARARRAAERE